MQQTWNDLLFAHWPVSQELLRPLVPPELPLDTYDGRCWVAVAPFHMSGIRARLMPRIPGVSALPELNVRTYVSYGGKAGVYFFSLDAASRLAVWAARAAYKLREYERTGNQRHPLHLLTPERARRVSGKVRPREARGIAPPGITRALAQRTLLPLHGQSRGDLSS